MSESDGFSSGVMAGAAILNAKIAQNQLRVNQQDADTRSQVADNNYEINKGYMTDTLATSQVNRQLMGQDLIAKQQSNAFNSDQMARAMFLQKGAADAGQQGGLPAVIDFFTQHDPQTALAMQSQVGAINQSLAQTHNLDSLTANAQQQFKMNAYSMLGGAGQMIQRLPMDQQQGAYAGMLPQLRQILPTMPDDYQQGNLIMHGAFGMSIPAAQLYTAQIQGMQMQSEIGKKQMDLARYTNNGGNDPEMIKGLQESIAQSQAEAQTAQLGVAEKKASIENTKEGQAQAISKEYTENSKDFLAPQKAFNNIVSLQASYDAPPGSPNGIKGSPAANDLQLLTNYIMMTKPNARPGDLQHYLDTDPALATMKKKFDQVQTGQALSREERQSVIGGATAIYDAQYSQQQQRYDGYKQLLEKRGLDAQYLDAAVPLASSTKMKQQYQSTNNMLTNLDPATAAQVKRAQDLGIPADKIQAAVAQKIQMQKGAQS